MCKQCGCGSEVTVHVDAGPHERRDVFVSVPCEVGECTGHHCVRRLDENGNVEAQVPSQCVKAPAPCCGEAKGELIWRIDHLAAGERATFVIGEPLEGRPELGVRAEVKDAEQADIYVGEQLFTSYVVREGIARPFCYPVYGPGGKLVVREVNFPPKEGIDHVHHKGIWVAQGDTNGTDNWSEMEGHGRTINTALRVDSQGPLFAQIHGTGDWVSNKGAKVLREDTTIRVYNTPDTARVMDFTTRWTAAYGGVFFGDTKEAGTVSIRLMESMEERKGGTIHNAFGAIGEAENWGKCAPWVDYYGPVEDRICGVAIMDHPTNLRYPTTWHVRSYGLFTANQWGLHDFTGDHSVRGDYALPAGQSLCFKFRLYIHENDTLAADVSGKYLDWIFPPNVSAAE